MSELQKLAEMNDVALGAAVGGGVGVAGGLLTTLLRQKPTLKKGLIGMLVGGSGGAAVGVGAMALKGPTDGQEVRNEAPAATPAPEPAPRSMNSTTAALTGLAPGTGPAFHGGQHGGVEQALRSGGRSALEGLGGSSLGLGIHLLAAKKGIKIPMWQAQAAGALGGSAHGAYAAAENFNEREKGASDEMNLTTAALMGDPTGLTAALHGYSAGGKEQASRSGMSSAGGGIYGGMLGLPVSALSRGKVGKGLGITAGSPTKCETPTHKRR